MLRFQDLEFAYDKVYEDKNGLKWTLSSSGNYFYNQEEAIYLSEYYNERNLASMTFKEMVNWNNIPIDTPVLVQNEGNSLWYKRYFAKVDKDGRIYTFPNGTTSFSCSDTLDALNELVIPWDIAKLAKTMD